MAIEVKSFFDKYSVPWSVDGPKSTKGWVNTVCPFCQSGGSHLGYSEKFDLFSCWKCGVKSTIKSMMKIANLSFDQAKKEYDLFFVVGSKKFEPKKKAEAVFLPENYGCLKKSHCDYLRGRNFDPKDLSKKWGLVGSADSNYKKSILIPIFFKGSLVTYTSRSIDENALYKARTCSSEKESLSYKDTLYGFDNVPGNTVIVSEGPSDVWRWGYGAVATYGTKFTERQVQLLSLFENVVIAFDGGSDEKQAQEQAEKLADRLSIFNNVWILDDLGCDPADLSQRKADKIIKEVKSITSFI